MGSAGKNRPAMTIVSVAIAATMVSVSFAQPASQTQTGDAVINIDRLRGDDQTSSFQFNSASVPLKNDAASGLSFQSLDGSVDPNSGGLAKLNDGKMPSEDDQPAENFFFGNRGSGGRIMLDLERPISIQQINSYSWHPSSRSDQVFKLYGSLGNAENFDGQPAAGVAPSSSGYQLLATIDTNSDQRGGGQVAVEIGSKEQPLGKYQYLLWDVSPAGNNSRFSNTFYSEIDVVKIGTEGEPAAEEKLQIVREYSFEEGKYTIKIDTTDCPDLTEWAERELMPEIQQWYPQLVAMLPSEGFIAPTSIKLEFTDSYNGVAATMGTRIVCSPSWFRRQLKREAKGAVIHELVHVVQQYEFWRRGGGRYRVPTWVTEGIADYIRWRQYEPAEKRGGVGGRSPSNMRYNASYRETASFFNWIIENGHPDFLVKLNAAIRDQTYDDEFWLKATGESVEDLARKWSESEAS